MNNVTSSSSNSQPKKFPQSQSQSQVPASKDKALKSERFPVNPLKSFSTRSSENSSSNGSCSGRFLPSHSLSSSSSSSSTSSTLGVAKTPKSAPILGITIIRKKPRFQLKSKVSGLHKSQRSKSNPKLDKASVFKKQSSVTPKIPPDESISQITPVSKLRTGSDLICRSNNEATDDGSYKERTPPVQASVSPEILMKLSASAQSEACYAAGHLLSGVSDKRKCKPKGILTIGDHGFDKARILTDEFDRSSCMMPLPVDASVHWVSSPCDDDKVKSDHDDADDLSQFWQLFGNETPSPLSDRTTTSDLCNISSGRSLSPLNRRTRSPFSPNELSRFKRFMEETSGFDTTPPKLDPYEHLKGEKLSPLSVDTLGSENLMQTPESNSSFDNYTGHSCSQGGIQKKDEVGSDLESLTMTLQSARLSPEEQSSSSFNFESLATCSESIDLSQFQRGLVERNSQSKKK